MIYSRKKLYNIGPVCQCDKTFIFVNDGGDKKVRVFVLFYVCLIFADAPALLPEKYPPTNGLAYFVHNVSDERKKSFMATTPCQVFVWLIK